jgi:hypothetical protein
MLILNIFLDQKSSKYFLRKLHFNLTIFVFATVWSWGEGGGGGAAECRYMHAH